MFADLDETLRQLLIQRVPIDLSEVDVSFEAPDREWSGRLSRPTVDMFLYDVQENLELRETDWEVRKDANGAIRKRRPVRIDATYLVTAWARMPEDEHRLLWRVLATLAKHPVLPSELLHGGMAEQPYAIQTKVARPDQLRTNPADLWQAVDNRIRPGLRYTATLALDTEMQFTSPLVFTRTQRLERLDADYMFETTSISGRVRQSTNGQHPVPDATVVLRETGARAFTDAEGKFRIPRAPRGPVTLVAWSPGRPEVTRTLEVPSPDYDLEV